MPVDPSLTIYFKKSRFTTRLPVNWKYAPSHHWLREVEPGVWQMGLTKFATRMLGDLVEHELTVAPGTMVGIGEPIGWLEGFKAIADVYSAMSGEFLQGNPRLVDEGLHLLDTDPYDAGWLYAIRGQPDSSVMDVEAYTRQLDATIEKMLLQRDRENPACPKPGT